MSAWRVGTEVAARTPPATGDETGGAPPDEGLDSEGGAGGGGGGGAGGGAGGGTAGDGKLQTKIDKVTKWIPGDALAIYAAGVTAFAAKQGARPSVILLIIGIVFAAAIVLAAAFASNGSIPSKTFLPASLAAGAFTIWSLSVPFSGWQRWDAVHDNQAAVAVVAAAAALFFGYVADGFTKRFGGG
jgi:hypothetical protein